MKRILSVLLAAVLLAVTAAAGPATPLEQRDQLMPRSAVAPASPVSAAARHWLVYAKPSRATNVVAAHYYLQNIGPGRGVWRTAIYEVPRRRLAPVVRALRRVGTYQKRQLDAGATSTQAAADPLDPFVTWRPMVVAPTLVSPPVSPTSPLLAIIDSPMLAGHAEFAGSATTSLRPLAPWDSHGTATAAIAGAPTNNMGITGLWPGMRVLNIPLPSAEFLCSDRVKAIAAAIKAHASVISLEYGSPEVCFGEYVAIQVATGVGIVVVAGSGNTGAHGNEKVYPASLPHVLTVAAVGADGQRAPFSTANASVDLSAPGANILTAVRPGDEGDPDGDGYAPVSGTSFAAAMVGAAAAWLSAVRPEFGRSALVFALEGSARDTGSPNWDPETGYGIVDMAAALQSKGGLIDPGEPDDDVEWIDGSVFAGADPTIGAGNHDDALAGFVDRYDDPADVFRVRLPAHGRARVTVTPLFGGIDLDAFAPSVRSISDVGRRVARSRQPGERADRVVLTNRASTPRTFYVSLRPNTLNSGYVLRLKRLPRARTLRSR